MRDSQRQRVYNSESKPGIWPEEFTKSRSLTEAQEFVASVTRTAWWKRRSNRKIVVRSGARYGRGWANLWTNEITTSPGSRTYRYLLHELAHFLTDEDVASHGPEYAANFVAITRQVAGKETGDALKASFRTGRVKVRGAKAPTRIIRRTCQCGRNFTVGTGWRAQGINANGEFHSKRCAVEWFTKKLKQG